MVGSMAEFKQIIGRGSRLRPDYGKFSFNILDYTGTAAEKFADPDFDGDPVLVEDIEVGPDGEERSGKRPRITWPMTRQQPPKIRSWRDHPRSSGMTPPIGDTASSTSMGERRRSSMTRCTASGRTADRSRSSRSVIMRRNAVRTLHTSADDLRATWRQREQPEALLAALDDAGSTSISSADALGQRRRPIRHPLSCRVRSPPHTRKERAQRLKDRQEQLLADYAPEAREVLAMLIDKYADHGPSQLELPAGLEVPPNSRPR